jgi:hypothetical protein
MQPFSIAVLTGLALFAASQSSVFNGKIDLTAKAAAAPATGASCVLEPTSETIALAGDFGIFTRGLVCSERGGG